MRVFYTIDNSFYNENCENVCPFYKNRCVGSISCVKECKHCYGNGTYKIALIDKNGQYVLKYDYSYGYVKCSKTLNTIGFKVSFQRFLYVIKLNLIQFKNVIEDKFYIWKKRYLTNLF